MESLFELFVQVCSGDPLVTSTWLVVLDQDRWPVVFSALEEHVQLLKVLWESLFEHLFCTRKLSKDVVATLFADRGWLSHIPASFPRRNRHGHDVKEHPELRKLVMQYMWRRSLGPCAPTLLPDELCKVAKQSR